MDPPLKWLPDASQTVWTPLENAMRNGFPVPAGFIVFPPAGIIVFPTTAENQIRAAYEQLKLRERTHFLAVRGASHPVLNIIGPDQLVHTARRLWTESPNSPLLIQRMIHALWCGKAQWHRRSLRINANEGMMLLDPDMYLLNSATGKCIRRTLQSKQRRMIRHVDGTAKIVQREGERTAMPEDYLKSIAELAVRAAKDIEWAIDDNDRLWLISVG
jgi:hypothetical protein